MKISADGIALIKRFESCELEAYPDPASPLGRACAVKRLRMRDYRQLANWKSLDGAPWTIGWGYTGPAVKPGMVLSQDGADQLLAQCLERFEREVASLVKVPVTQGQFDALVSFAFNCGSDIDSDDDAEGLGDSTLLKRLNTRDMAGAASEFLKWNKARGVVLMGLVRRRAAERELFLAGAA